MKISVIIPVKNQAENLEKCLFSLSCQTCQEFQIIVIDNNSRPSQTQAIRDLCCDFDAVYDFEPIPGAYASRNRGLSLSTGELIGFTDADCKPWSSWVSGAVMAFEIYGFDAVAGHINFTFSAEPPPIGELIDSFTHFQQQQYASNGYGAGANLWIRKDCFDKVGTFRSDMLNLGDREWGQRAKRMGVMVVYSALSTVDHPARNWSELLEKLWRQMKWKNYLKPFIWRDIIPAAIVPWQNYQGVIRDTRLPGFRKIRFILALHWIGILQSLRITLLIIVHIVSSWRRRRSRTLRI
jgi:glycosyltransferase involved in cell wall biosynthesis